MEKEIHELYIMYIEKFKEGKGKSSELLTECST